MTSDNDIYRWYADVIVYRGFGPLITILGVVGGILSLFVFRRKSLRKKSCSIYFFYLALADLLCMICWLVHFVLPTYNIHILTLSNFFCKMFVFAMYFAFDLANYILTVCSIDRAISVLCPIRSRKFCRERTAYTITFILVIIHTLSNSHLLYGFVILSATTISSPPIRICHDRVDSETYRIFFSIYDSYVDIIKTNAIPFLIMFVCNIIIIIRVCRSKSLMNFNGKNRRRKAKRRFEKDRQLTLMLLGSAIAFLVLTLPTEINDIIRSHSQDKVVTEKAYLLSAILLSCAHLNYAAHFYIYTLTGDVFRQELLKLWLINATWPYIVALRGCKLSNSTISSETSTNQRISVRNNQSTQMDALLFTIKINDDDNDSLT